MNKVGHLNRLYLISVSMMLFALVIVFKMYYLYINEGEKYRSLEEKNLIIKKTIPAIRGNIYTSDGILLATNLITYDIAIDPQVANDYIFNKEKHLLAVSLSKMNTRKSSNWILDRLENARKSKSRYLKLKRNVSYEDLKKIENFPILKYGRFKGGLIIEKKSTRIRPLPNIAQRTIGFDDERGRAGLEGGYSEELSGKDGFQYYQKIGNSSWRPLAGSEKIMPINGFDLYSTINSRMQEITHNALMRGLKKHEANHGTAVIMEVSTGRILSISNLGRSNSYGEYYEKRNYAVYESAEPGSTFKLMSIMACLEDDYITLKDKIETKNGKLRFYNRVVKDSRPGGLGTIDVEGVFAHSSNVGIAKIVHNFYKDNPSKFLKYLKKWKLNQKLGIIIPGEGEPYIPEPNSKDWSRVTLPWMSHGYGIHITPLQTLSFYNAVANNGNFVKPRFVDKFSNGQKVKYKTESGFKKIASSQTIGDAKSIMRSVVTKGNCKNLKNLPIAVSGKTGTTQLNYWKSEFQTDYMASFVGYFPSDKPIYSCIVVVNKPKKSTGFYGSEVAAPIFAEIVKRIFISFPVHDRVYMVNKDSLKFKFTINSNNFSLSNKPLKMPKIIGKNPVEVIAELENRGFKVKVQGNGIIKGQSPEEGQDLQENQTIFLELQS